MMTSDPIADMLTRIRNANTAKHDTVDVPCSKMKVSIAEILLKEGYIKKFDMIDVDGISMIHITLKYGADKNEKIITGLKRISKPGLRVYASKEEYANILTNIVEKLIEYDIDIEKADFYKKNLPSDLEECVVLLKKNLIYRESKAWDIAKNIVIFNNDEDR